MGKYDNAKGLIFNMVNGSFVDGWGIRTTIFLKGCPLRCIWCCNPEGQLVKNELKVSFDKCSLCGKCPEVCKNGAISLAGNQLKVDRTLCNDCGKCVNVCDSGALEMFGKWFTVNEMFDIIIKDKPFYDASNGGLTIGGGEASLYPEFCLGLIEKCHENGITAAIDTCGYCTTELGFEALAKADFLLFDIKGMNDEVHIKNTGFSNSVIHNNLSKLNDLGQSFIIRYPAITGYNDSNEELNAAADYLTQFKGIKRIDVIPVHRYGEIKYQQLGRNYNLDAPSIPDDRQLEIKQIFASRGFETQLGG